jgi:hypothetical protein
MRTFAARPGTPRRDTRPPPQAGTLTDPDDHARRAPETPMCGRRISPRGDSQLLANLWNVRASDGKCVVVDIAHRLGQGLTKVDNVRLGSIGDMCA